MLIDLFKTVKDGKTDLWLVGKHKCSHCGKELFGPAYLCSSWVRNNLQPLIQVFCINHVSKRFKMGFVGNIQVVGVIDDVPFRAIRVFLTPPVLTSSRDCSVFDISKLKSDFVVDKTVHAGRFSLEGSSVGVSLPEPDVSLLSLCDANNKLLSFKHEINIPFVDKLLIGDGL